MNDQNTEESTVYELEIFRAGDYGAKGSYSEGDLDAIARDYNPAQHEAAVTVDHEQSGPAHGWVSGLRRLGDRLLATLTKLSPALITALKTHAYKKRSVELYRQFPETGRPYLKALTFLGAGAPEVKGLADPQFSESAPAVVRFDETPPHPIDHGAIARERLMRRGLWKPEWNNTPLLDAFRGITSTEHVNALISAFESFAPAITFGRVENSAAPDAAAIHFTGTASAESLQRHNAAMALMRANPRLDYRDALLASAS